MIPRNRPPSLAACYYLPTCYYFVYLQKEVWETNTGVSLCGCTSGPPAVQRSAQCSISARRLQLPQGRGPAAPAPPGGPKASLLPPLPQPTPPRAAPWPAPRSSMSNACWLLAAHTAAPRPKTLLCPAMVCACQADCPANALARWRYLGDARTVRGASNTSSLTSPLAVIR